MTSPPGSLLAWRGALGANLPGAQAPPWLTTEQAPALPLARPGQATTAHANVSRTTSVPPSPQALRLPHTVAGSHAVPLASLGPPTRSRSERTPPRVAADAPFAVAESFGTPEHPLVYLQATDTAEDEWTPPDEIARFLLPVTHPDAGGTRIVPSPIVQVPQPDERREESGAPRPKFAATHKWEADDEHGDAIGPLIVWDNQTDTIAWESDD